MTQTSGSNAGLNPPPNTMNRRTFTHTGTLAMAAASLTAATGLGTEDEQKIGRLSASQFKKLNADAATTVKSLKASTVTLSEADARLMSLIAAGGMMQLKASEMALKNASSEDVRVIAQAEVLEQTGLSAKLAEFAAFKQVAAPADPHEATAALLDELKAQKGAAFDRAYLAQSGVKGHELLRDTMTKVQSEAADPDLKALAMATLPLIETHLNVSKDEMASMG